MKKLTFFLFAVFLGLGMTGFASAAPWGISVVDNTYGPVTLEEGDKVEIVFVPTDSYDLIELDWGGVAAGSDVKVVIGGHGMVSTGHPEDTNYPITVNSNGKIQLKLKGMAGSATLNLASLGNTVGSFEKNQGTHAPEPASMLLLGSGLAGMAALGRRKFFKK